MFDPFDGPAPPVDSPPPSKEKATHCPCLCRHLLAASPSPIIPSNGSLCTLHLSPSLSLKATLIWIYFSLNLLMHGGICQSAIFSLEDPVDYLSSTFAAFALIGIGIGFPAIVAVCFYRCAPYTKEDHRQRREGPRYTMYWDKERKHWVRTFPAWRVTIPRHRSNGSLCPPALFSVLL